MQLVGDTESCLCDDDEDNYDHMSADSVMAVTMPCLCDGDDGKEDEGDKGRGRGLGRGGAEGASRY